MSAEVDVAAILAGVLADTGLKATLVFAGAGLAARALRRSSAAVRHALWASALASAPLLAAASLAHRGVGLALDVQPAWLLVWGAGVVVTLAPLGHGLAALLSARRNGTAEGGVIWSHAVDVPLTFARTILMPGRARSWSAEELRAARLHELAHVRRGDWWVHVGAWVTCSLLWFHPLAWWARQHLSLEAERAADDRVLAAGVVPSDYARQLLSLARGPAAGLSMARSAAALRVRAILGVAHRGACRWPVVVVSVGLGLLAGPSLSAWALWTPPPPSTGCRPTEILP